MTLSRKFLFRLRIKTFLTSFFLLSTLLLVAQGELDCQVRVNADQAETTERRIFKDMEVAFAQFLNSRKWTSDTYQNFEKVKCNQRRHGQCGGQRDRCGTQKTHPEILLEPDRILVSCTIIVLLQ